MAVGYKCECKTAASGNETRKRNAPSAVATGGDEQLSETGR